VFGHGRKEKGTKNFRDRTLQFKITQKGGGRRSFRRNCANRKNEPAFFQKGEKRTSMKLVLNLSPHQKEEKDATIRLERERP